MTGEDIRTAHGHEIRTRYSPREERYQTALYRDGEVVWHSFEDTFEEAVTLAEEMAQRLNEERKPKGINIKAFSLIAAERAAQDAQWGGKAHSTEELLIYITRHVHFAETSNRHGQSDDLKDRLVKIAALAVAALEGMEENNQ